MKFLRRICSLILLLAMLIEGSSSVFWADVISNEDVDKEIVKTYVNCVNEKSYAELTELFCNEQK